MNDIFLPPEFEIDIYRKFNQDLLCKFISDVQIARHYEEYGRNEGRIANRLLSRSNFVNLITNDMKTLEIGPFTDPVVSGENVIYADYLDQNELIERARLHDREYKNTPFIKYVTSKIPLSDIPEEFDIVISSHCIEHQPDLISHLLDIQRLIENRNGMYFLLVPDKRYCFDRYINESTIADILDAHRNGLKVHSLKNVISHRALTTHNDSVKHWEDADFQRPIIDYKKVDFAIKEFDKANGSYIDVHSWFFTPASFYENINLLNALGIINLKVERVYFTRRNAIEFWAILKYH